MFEQELFNAIKSSPECVKIFNNRVYVGIAPPNTLELGKPFIVSCDLSRTAIGRNLSGKNTSFLHMYQIEIFADKVEQLKTGEEVIMDAVKECKFDNFSFRVYDDLFPYGSKIWLRSSSDLIVTI